MAEESFWEKAGDVLLGGIGKAVDAEFTESQRVNTPDQYRQNDTGTSKAGVPVTAGPLGVPLWGWGLGLAALIVGVVAVARR